MTQFLSRISSQVQLAFVPHNTTDGDVWQLQRHGTTTNDGTASGTTIEDSDLGGSDDDFNGKYWIHILDGDAKGEWRRIANYVASGGVVTLEGNGFTSQITSGTAFELWKSPETVLVATQDSSFGGAYGPNHFFDDTTGKPDDYWIGWTMVPITGSGINDNRAMLITDFEASTGKFVLSGSPSWGATVFAGTPMLLRKFVDATDISAGITEEYIPRGTTRTNFAKGDGVVGPRGGTFGFSIQIRPSGSLASNNNKPGNANITGLMESVGLEEFVGTSTTADSGSTTTSIKIATGTRERFEPGSMVIHNGNATFVTSITDGGASADTLTVSPALPTAPASSDVIHATRLYKRSTDGDTQGVTFEYVVDGVRHTLTGCKGNVTLNDGAAPTLSFEYQVDHWIRNIQSPGYANGSFYDATAPILAQERLAYLAGSGVDINGFTATPGTEVVAKSVQGSSGVNGRSGYQISNFAAGATFNKLLDASTATLPEDDFFQKRTAKELSVVFGSHSETFGVHIPQARMIESPNPTDLEGVVGAPNVLEAQATTDLNVLSQPVAVPDFSFSIS